jgi:hypothetical protein
MTDIPDPRLLSYDQWIYGTLQVICGPVLPFIPHQEASWQMDAAQLVVQPALRQHALADPRLFDDWWDWAERLRETLSI